MFYDSISIDNFILRTIIAIPPKGGNAKLHGLRFLLNVYYRRLQLVLKKNYYERNTSG